MHPWERDTVVIDGVQVSLKNFDGHLILDFGVPPEDRKQGNASRVLKQILNIVDEHAIYAEVNPTPHQETNGPAPTKHEIVDWFKKFGFTNIVYGNMERTPEISEGRFNVILDKIQSDGIDSLSKEEKDMMKRYSGDTTPVMDTKGKEERVDKLKNQFVSAMKQPTEKPVKKLKLSTTPVADKSFDDPKDFKVDPSYTTFAVRKSNRKIVTGWEYKDLKGDPKSIREYTKMDLHDMFPDNKYTDFQVLNKATLKRMGIDPFSWDSWEKHRS